MKIIMKKIFIIIITFTILFTGCEDILQVSPSSSFDSKDGVITTIERAELVVNGMYDGLQNQYYYGNYILTFGDLHTDNMYHSGTFVDSRQVDMNEIIPSNGITAQVWDQLYSVISIANSLYTDVPEIENIPQETSDRIQGEALFVRALSYFSLVKNWDGVPLQLTPVRSTEDIEKLSRETVANVYLRITTDLEEAITKLADFDEPGRANAWAAKALLSRVQLYQGNFQDAYDYANDVIENGPYTFVTDYADIFTYQNEYCTESIFEVDFTSQDANSLAFWYHPDDLGGRYEYGVDTSFLNAYDVNDVRYDASVGYYFDTDEYFITKYTDVSGGGDNVIVLRLSEMYLNRAEALVNGATPAGADTQLEDFNQTYTRAGLGPHLGPITEADILNERRFEFAFEGHRWYDLKRTGEAINVLTDITSTDQYLWPIPQDERDVNTNLTQNPGY